MMSLVLTAISCRFGYDQGVFGGMVDANVALQYAENI